MTRAELARELCERWLPRKEAFAMVVLLFDTLKAILVDVKTGKTSGSGIFIVRKKIARKDRNVKKEEDVPLDPRRIVVFKPTAHLTGMVKNKQERRYLYNLV